MRLHSIVVPALLWASPAAATDVALIGTFESKAAILSIDAGAPKTVRVGQRFGGVTVVAVEKDRATIEVDGARRSLVRGQSYNSGAASSAQSVTLSADARGHFMAEGMVNGAALRFVVDTGATAIALPASDASRLGIDYLKGERGRAQTANGQAPAYLVRLNTVRIGGIELRNVDAVVIEHGLDVALLGNTFLNRVEMRREGGTMTLTRRY
jgi:aspartyl protease family protein